MNSKIRPYVKPTPDSCEPAIVTFPLKVISSVTENKYAYQQLTVATNVSGNCVASFENSLILVNQSGIYSLSLVFPAITKVDGTAYLNVSRSGGNIVVCSAPYSATAGANCSAASFVLNSGDILSAFLKIPSEGATYSQTATLQIQSS